MEDKNVVGKLTSEQIRWSDEISFDYDAAENTLKVAMAFHSNRMNELRKERIKLWNDLAESNNLDTTKEWVVERQGNVSVIVEKVDD